MIRENWVKKAIHAGKKTIGGWLQLGSTMSAEILSQAGFDWLLVDCEHSPMDFQALMMQYQAMSASNSIPLCRAPWNDAVAIKRILDVGAYGVMVPWVNDKEQAEMAVKACKYPPEGIRGVASSVRAAGYTRHGAEYLKRANDEIMVIVQIETATAVKNIKEILSVKGIDVAFIGPADLSTAMGYAGNREHPEVQAAIAAIESAAKEAKVALGTVSSNLEQGKQLWEKGYQFIHLTGDVTLLAKGSTETVNKFRSEVK
jgi:2-dehydro-3-deoxyglucarate aldolase/4-hydroxy-2-oxoheptanedioate aldolase